MKKVLLAISMLLLLAIAAITSCKKNNNAGGGAQLQIRLTDAPGNYEEVNVDIRDVRIKFNDDSLPNDGWIAANANAGVYNLLALQNGVDTLIASVNNLPQNQIVREIRFYLGNNNTIKVNGQIYPLEINEGDRPKLKIKISKKLGLTLNTVVVDFDAALSIREMGNNRYRLIPVLKIK